jgi:SAM-dependent methyltransferase
MLRRPAKKLARVVVDSLPNAAADWIWQLANDRRTSQSPDRVVLVRQVFPALRRASALSKGANVLWIGCRRYTRGYYALLERDGAQCASIDIDPFAERWGRRGRHLVGDILDLPNIFPTGQFDAVLCNGVLGWGVDAPADQLKAFEAMAAVMAPQGWLLVGWNTDRMDDPLISGLGAKWFDHIALPEFRERYAVGGCTHVFDTYRRRADNH